MGLNGHRLTWTNDEAHDVVNSVASGELDEIAVIADGIAAAMDPW